MHPNQNPKLDDPALLAGLEAKVAALKKKQEGEKRRRLFGIIAGITAGLAVIALIAYALAYAGSLVVLGRSPGFEAGESLAVLLIFGVGCSVVAWLATIGVKAATYRVDRPRTESLAIRNVPELADTPPLKFEAAPPVRMRILVPE